MQEIGTVISSENSPTTSSFLFLISPSSSIRKGQFVQLETPQGLLIGRIGEISKMNRYFMRAESVGEYEKSGKRLSELFPVDKWEYLVGEVIPLGIHKDGLQKRVLYPPSPGQKVYLADKDILSSFLGFDKNGLNLGKLEFHEIEVKLNLTKLFQKHLAILAISGAGKSYAASVLIEEILDRRDELGKPAIIVIDPHGEYVGFGEDEKYSSKTKIYEKKDFSIGVQNLSVSTLAELIPQMSSVQKRELIPIIKKLREEKRVYDMNELIAEIEESKMNPKTKYALIGWLNDLNLMGLFGKVDSSLIDQMARSGELSVLDLSEFVHLRERQTIVTYFGRRLFEERRKGNIPPFILFVEEAHQFAPGLEEKELAISRGIIEQIAREGRKFGACLVLISQRPKRLSITALSQCNTHLILRITNPIDLRHIEESSEGVTKDVMNTIPGLKVGEALLVGEVVNYPLLLKIREKRCKKVEKIGSLEEMLRKFSNSKKSLDEDLEAFM